VNNLLKYTRKAVNKWYTWAIAIILMVSVAGCGNNGATDQPGRGSSQAGTTSESSDGTQQPGSQRLEDQIVGRWELVSGDWIYFFRDTDVIDFYDDGTVIARYLDTLGEWAISESNELVVTDRHGDDDFFAVMIDGNRLTITDGDNDSAVYARASRDRQPNDQLVGRWELVSGSLLFFFDDTSTVDILYDGTIISRDYRDVGEWEINGNRLFVSYDGNTGFFTFELVGSELSITNEYGDTDLYRRAS